MNLIFIFIEIERSLFDTSEEKIVHSDLRMRNTDDSRDIDYSGTTVTVNSTTSTYAMSKDGLYIAWESEDGKITVMNTNTHKVAELTAAVGTADQN